uniref:Putative capsid protein n=1 Tax=Pacific flying fox faeces associated circular DNA molecule-2 TaxID=1796020 RepID=A0A140CTU7_9ZZZZ|nr:putative capsid protein [Pacific flying fox faeces associated circular DNA molecule-2]
MPKDYSDIVSVIRRSRRRAANAGKRKVNGRQTTRVTPGTTVKMSTKASTSENGTKKRVEYRDIPGAELSTKKVVGGRLARKNLRGAWKAIDANKNANVYFYEKVNRYMTPQPDATYPPGATVIASTWDNPSGTYNGQFTAPVHLYSLTAAPQGSDAASRPTARYTLVRPSESASYITFQKSTEVWKPINTAQGETLSMSYPGQMDVLKAVSLKFVLFGALTRPVRYRIDMVQILDQTLQPDWLYNYGSQQGPEQAAALAFWTELHREYLFSPCSFANGNATKGKIKYIKSWTHLFQPRDTTETGAGTGYDTSLTPIAHSHIFNIYHRFNRIQRYNYSDTGFTTEPTAGVDTPITNFGVNRQDVHPRARIYLMVRALSCTPNVKSQNVPAISPSYDLSMRTYHEQFA